MTAPLTPDTLNTIRRNAGKVAPFVIAQSLGWTLAQLERVARDRQIDLHVSPKPPDHDPLTAHAIHHPHRLKAGVPHSGRTERCETKLFVRDANLLGAEGSKYGLSRSRALARLVENARERRLLEELLRLPAPGPKEGEGM